MKKFLFLTLAMTFLTLGLFAQTACNNQIINGDFSAGDVSFTSGLTQSCNASNCVIGAYCVGNNFQSKCSDWPDCYDHTFGDPTGSFLIIDGDLNNPITVWASTATIVLGNDYKFSFWVKSVHPSSDQIFDLEVLINSVSQSPFVNINQTIPMWTEYSLEWCPPPGTPSNVPISIRQVSAGHFRDFGIDDISFCAIDCNDFYNTFLDSTFTTSDLGNGLIEFFPPPGIVSTDILIWEFGDGDKDTQSGSDPSVTHLYDDPDSYLASLCILHPLPCGDTCKIKLCDLVEVPITCEDCQQFLSQTTVSMAVDMSNWATSGMVTFRPVPGFSPYNINVCWDFDCDGSVDTTTMGNAPVSYNYPCGQQVLCYTVKCMLSQQVPCYAELKETVFNIPCPANPDDCCADFMTDVMDQGILGTGLGGNTYNFCLSNNINASDIVQWDLDCDGTINGTNSICETFTLNPGNVQICATVLRFTPNGDTCRVKVNACLSEIEPIDSCSCDSFQADVDAGFSWNVVSAPLITFTPISLIDNCDSVTWDWNDGSALGSSLGTDPISHLYPAPGDYFVCMKVTRTEPNGLICEEKEYCFNITVPVMASEIVMPGPRLMIQPNPNSGQVTVILPAKFNNKNYELCVSSIQGQTRLSVPIQSDKMDINIQHLPAGLYFISLINEQGSIVIAPQKIVKL